MGQVEITRNDSKGGIEGGSGVVAVAEQTRARGGRGGAEFPPRRPNSIRTDGELRADDPRISVALYSIFFRIGKVSK